MKKYSQFLESMSVIMIYILLLQITCCNYSFINQPKYG